MIIQLSVGGTIYTKRYLKNEQIKNWKFKNEFVRFGHDIMPGTAFTIVEVNKIPGNMWVRVGVPGTHPQQYFKIAGEEFAHNFRV